MSTAYSSVVLHDNPIRYYRLGETSGTTALDSGSQGKNGTINGTVTPVAGLITADPNGAMLFDGSSGYVNLPTTGLPSGNSSYSLECWASFAANPGFFPMTFSLGTRVSQELVDIFLAPDNTIHAEIVGQGSIGSSVESLNTPYYLVVTCDGTTLILYVNGIMINTLTPTMNITYGAAAIGAQGSPLGNYWNGTIDEVAIYSSVLSATQIAHHYAVGTRLSFVGNQGSRRNDPWRR